ncbi:MAG: 2-C-methyl-D-erythritol 2,4-cyclodiphosphate synthase, partial [Salinivirgaceae bacterium]|nr:2-C-methyl-D-erythritol 2,4-cyclodiphosphate synthase [Salinivirgaceae bacterium]
MIPRIGFGYDVHQLAEGETFILGGIKIEHYNGTIAHSDGDVLVHANLVTNSHVINSEKEILLRFNRNKGQCARDYRVSL